MFSDSIIHCQSTCRHCHFHGNTEGQMKIFPLLSAKLLSALSALCHLLFLFHKLVFHISFLTEKEGTGRMWMENDEAILQTISKKIHSFMIFHESGLVT